MTDGVGGQSITISSSGGPKKLVGIVLWLKIGDVALELAILTAGWHDSAPFVVVFNRSVIQSICNSPWTDEAVNWPVSQWDMREVIDQKK